MRVLSKKLRNGAGILNNRMSILNGWRHLSAEVVKSPRCTVLFSYPNGDNNNKIPGTVRNSGTRNE